MARTSIGSPQHLHDWLEAHGYFKEGYCLASRPTAEEYPTEYGEHLDKPKSIYIELAIQAGGGSMAGEVRVMRVFGCTGDEVQEWTPSSSSNPYMDEGVQVVEEMGGLLALDIGVHGRLVCGRLSVEQLPDRTVPVEAHLDPSSVSVRVPEGAPPAPRAWIEWFKQAGEDVAWRVHGGEEWPVEELSSESYSAFLQERRNIPTTAGGIFIDVRFEPEDPGFGVLLDDGRRWAASAPGQEKLWLIARKALLTFPNAQFRTGNCVLTAEQWREYLLRGVLPYPL